MKSSSVDNSIVREINQRAVLTEAFRQKVTSRTALAKNLSMSKPAIADNLNALIDMGIIQETGEGEGAQSGGRKPVMLQFNKNHKNIIAVDLNHRNPVFALGNLDNEILREFDIQVSKNTSIEAYANVIENGISILLNARNLTAEDLVCVAIASPGVFDEEGQLISSNPRFSGAPWSKIDFVGRLSKRFGVDVIVKNDINAATLGEWSYTYSDEQNLLFISCGVGLGAGVILGSQLFEGQTFSAGEIYTYTDKEHLERGVTIEQEVSMSHLLNRMHKDVKAGIETRLPVAEKLTLEDVIKAYQQEDPYTRQVVGEVCQEIGVIAYNCANLLAMDKIVFGGEYTAFGKTLLDEFRRLNELGNNRHKTVELSTLGKFAGIHGLLYLARERYFDAICKRGYRGMASGE